jgi:hypothetical protein
MALRASALAAGNQRRVRVEVHWKENLQFELTMPECLTDVRDYLSLEGEKSTICHAIG